MRYTLVVQGDFLDSDIVVNHDKAHNSLQLLDSILQIHTNIPSIAIHKPLSIFSHAHPPQGASDYRKASILERP